MRIATSVKDGWCSAVLALDRLGAEARGDPVLQAAVTLGRLVRTQFLCVYLTNSTFRRALHRCLAHGESVHQLQRTIMTRPITAKRGRSPGEQTAISGVLAKIRSDRQADYMAE